MIGKYILISPATYILNLGTVSVYFIDVHVCQISTGPTDVFCVLNRNIKMGIISKVEPLGAMSYGLLQVGEIFFIIKLVLKLPSGGHLLVILIMGGAVMGDHDFLKTFVLA